MSCLDACVKENPTYARTICVFCRAIICTKSLGKHTSLVDAEKLEIQKIKAHCEHCKEYQRALRSSKIEKGHYTVKFKYFTPKEFK